MASNLPAIFDYPQARDKTFQYVYNYKDSVNVSWTSYAANSTAVTLQLFYWVPNNNNEPWRALDLHTVPANGSMPYALDAPSAAYSNAGYYLGQWNLNFTKPDGKTGLTISQTFRCNFDETLRPASYGPIVDMTTPSIATSSSISISSATATSTPSAQGTGSTSVPASGPGPSQAGGSMPVSPSGHEGVWSVGAVVGIVVGLLIAIVLGALASFFLLRRRYRNKNSGASDRRQPAPGMLAGSGWGEQGMAESGRGYGNVAKLYPEPGNPFNNPVFVLPVQTPTSATSQHAPHELLSSNGSTGNYAFTSELYGSSAPPRPRQELSADRSSLKHEPGGS